MGPLRDWHPGDKLSATHLNEAWKRLRQYLPIIGGDGVIVHSNATGGTVIDVDLEHVVGESIDVEITAHGDSDNPYWQDPRYLVQADEVQQDPAADQHDTPNIVLDLDYAQRAPGEQFMAFNLAEMAWGSHYLHIGDHFTAHRIFTSLNSSTPGQTWAWWVFCRPPDPVRSAEVTGDPVCTDLTLTVIDEYQSLSGNNATSTVVISEHVAPMVGAELLTAGDTIHYVPDSYTHGWIVGYQAWKQLDLGYGCKDAGTLDTVIIHDARKIAFHPGQFELETGVPSDCAGFADASDTLTITWLGFKVEPPASDTADAAVCKVEVLQFETDASGEDQTYPSPVDFTLASDTDARCDDGCDPPIRAIVKGAIFYNTDVVTVITGAASATNTVAVNDDCTVTVSTAIYIPTATMRVVIPW